MDSTTCDHKYQAYLKYWRCIYCSRPLDKQVIIDHVERHGRRLRAGSVDLIEGRMNKR